jgi:hypothetical protein
MLSLSELLIWTKYLKYALQRMYEVANECDEETEALKEDLATAEGMAEQHAGPSSGSRDRSDLVIQMESSPTSIPNWGVHMSGKEKLGVWTQAELPDCFGSATQPHRSMKEFCELGDGT